MKLDKVNHKPDLEQICALFSENFIARKTA